MKFLTLLLFFLFFQTAASAACYEFDLLGEGIIEEKGLAFVVAKNTQSQTKLIIPFKDQDILVPYVERWTRARMILSLPEVNFNTKVIKVISAQYETPDPLNLSSKTSMIKRKEVACPKG